MKAVILYRKGYGNKSCPAMAEMLGDSKAVMVGEDIPESDWLIRWGTSAFVYKNRKTINKKEAIMKSATKSEMRYLWSCAGIAPQTFLQYAQFAVSQPQGWWIVRPVEHMRSRDLTLCTTPDEVKKACQDHPGGYYISQYIPKVAEYRVFTAQGRIFGMISKKPENRDEISWGCVDTGKFEYVPWSFWPKSVQEIAIKSLGMTGLDFAAIDIIVDSENRAYVLETNTAPWCNSEYWQTKHVQVFNYMINTSRDPFPEPLEWDWQKTIHPATQG